MDKKTRAESIALAQAARKLPIGVVSDRVYIQSNQSISDRLIAQNPTERGVTYALGSLFEDNGFLLIYDILDKLGVRIISTIVGAETTIVLRGAVYSGNSQIAILIEILKDALDGKIRADPQ